MLHTAGGLPNSWLGPAKQLRALNRLNLAFNQLGWTADASGGKGAQSARLADWCSAVEGAPREGWCPSGTPLGGTLLKLQILDLSANSFVGKRSTCMQASGGRAYTDHLGHSVPLVAAR